MQHAGMKFEFLFAVTLDRICLNSGVKQCKVRPSAEKNLTINSIETAVFPAIFVDFGGNLPVRGGYPSGSDTSAVQWSNGLRHKASVS